MIKKFFEKYEIKELFISLIFSIILVSVLLFLIFKLAPDSAYISYEAENVESISNIKFKSFDGTIQLGSDNYKLPRDELKFVKNNGCLEITNFDNLFFEIDQYPLNISKENDQNMKIGYVNNVIFDLSQIYGLEIVPLSPDSFIKYIYYDSPAILHIATDDFYSNIEYPENSVVINTISSNFSITLKGWITWGVDRNPSETRFYGCYGYIHCKNGTKIDIGQVNSINISDYFSYKPRVSPENELTLGTPEVAIIPVNYYDYSILDMNIRNITSINTIGSGKLSFSYTKKPDDFQLMNQSFFADNTKNLINMKIEKFSNYENNENNKFYTNGTIYQNAMLSENNLFPDISTWFRENVYLAPLALLTTIIGTFAIKPKDKKEKNNEDDKLKKELLKNANTILQMLKEEKKNSKNKK